MVQRILKTMSALGAGMGITLATQFLLPPAFIHYYGVSKFGEWLVLSATIGYLGSLNFGITTYASNELTILRKRGEMEKYRELQGSTLAMLLGMIAIGLAATAFVFVLPMAKLLHLSLTAPGDVAFTACFLGLQAMANILGGYYNNLFMVVESPHRCWNWFNARRLGATLVSVPLAMMRAPLSAIAFGQLAVVFLVVLLSISDLKRRMGNLPLGLGGANWATAKASLAPSGMFAMIFMQTFLVFQAPVIMLQWLLGPEIVVLFTISRTVLSTARQLLQTVTYAIAPEITFSFADRDLKKLLHIFHYSEKVVFAVIPIANLGAYLFSPVLLAVWLHKPQLFDSPAYALMAMVSCVMSMREHKQFFQFSTNTHKRLSIIVFFGNLLMIAVSIPLTQRFGLHGFMWTWFISEAAQMGLLYRENKKLFHRDPSINLIPALKLVLVLLVSLPLCAVLLHCAAGHSILAIGGVALAGMSMLVAESYFVFGLQDVWNQCKQRMFLPVEDAA